MSKIIGSTPKQDGFFMPGEHLPHEGVYMAWPERPDNWRWGAKPAQDAFARVAEAIQKVTNVTMLVSAAQYDNARDKLSEDIRIIEMSTNDSWLRDIGPSYVVNKAGERRGVSWHFNAWGGLVDGLYFPWDQDDKVAQKVCEIERDDLYQAPFILEGGSIHVDGDGTIYTTAECLLHPSRNPDLTKEEIEDLLKEYLGAEKVIWLDLGLYNDETNGHVDNILHVVRPGEVVLSWTEDEADPQYQISQKAYEVLTQEKDAKGRAIKVHKITIPGPLYINQDEAGGIDAAEGMERQAGERLAASYANYLITNKHIILPLLDPKQDEAAKETLQKAYPDYTIIGVEAREILLGGGNIHCITQQVPKKG